ncbi:MAG: hypothetical protein HYR66_07015 [Sphingobacteriales bacterium]|nr:hypothetical protein [Sphingobacteriales bacterium]MBI3718273.1 hypothetical protein [Sphingobacteriales bacterium]
MNNSLRTTILVAATLLVTQNCIAQLIFNSDSVYRTGTPNSGRIWGYAFGDFYYKSHSDSFSRGNANQYSGIPKNRSAFQIRRVYIGYDYNITKKFSAELLLAAEDNLPAGTPPGSTTPSGDLLADNKLSFFVKLINLRWKQIWKGTDLVLGQVATPSFVTLTEKVWSYRSIERTLIDIRRTPSYDLGVALQGFFDPLKKYYGYNLMIGNGSTARPENDAFKWFYGDVYAYLLKKKMVVDLYADYERLNWSTLWHHSRQMIKGFIGYNSIATEAKGMDASKGFSAGVEFFVNHLQKDIFASKIAGGADTLSSNASGISLYVHGDIIKSKLRYFARFDEYKPFGKTHNELYIKYIGNTSNYNDNSFVGSTATGDETYTQQFVTAGVDYIPAKNIHFIPNFWYNHYSSRAANATNRQAGDYDLVFRITFHYIFGK